MPKTRATHGKSRNGCIGCKQRHVKCNEQRPCSNCVRRDVECSLLDRPSTSATPVQQAVLLPKVDASTPRPSENNTIACVELRNKAARLQGMLNNLNKEIQSLTEEANQLSKAEPRFAQTLGENSHCDSPEWKLDIQLFHHFCSSTYLTLTTDKQRQKIWKEIVPQIAFKNDFVMHALLALSAFHLAHLNPEKCHEYNIPASQHQNMSVNLFSSALGQPELFNEEECHAYFVTASLVFMARTASILSPSMQTEALTMSDLVQTFMIMQGIKSILSIPSAMRWASSGPLAPFYGLDASEIKPIEIRDEYTQRLDSLVHLVRRIFGSLKAFEIRSACFLALETLRLTYSTLCGSPERRRRIHMWPIVVGQTFMDLLNQKNQAALVILAHYAALMNCYEYDCWYLRGFSERIINLVEPILEESWKKYGEWPIRCVREGVVTQEALSIRR